MASLRKDNSLNDNSTEVARFMNKKKSKPTKSIGHYIIGKL